MINQLDIFVRNLKNIINDRDIKINNLAQKMGVSGPLVSNVLSGAQTPSIKFILKVSEVLNITVAELFTPDIRQFPVKQDIEEANLAEIIEMQRAQIASLEEELELAMEENERAAKELIRYQFKEDGMDLLKEDVRCNDGKVKLFVNNGTFKATINNTTDLQVLSYNVSPEICSVEIKVDELHIDYK